MHDAAWHRQTPESKFTKFRKEMSIGQTPNHAKFCGDPTKVSEIALIENLRSQKVGQNSPKLLKTCYSLKPHIMPNFIKISETTLKKSVTINFYTLQYFGSARWPPGPKVTGLGGRVHQPPSSYLQNFIQFQQPLSKISAAKLRWFCCRRDPQKHTVNDMSPHYMRRQKGMNE